MIWGTTPHEGISQRYASSRRAKDQRDAVGGIATIGYLAGSASTIKMSKWFSPELAGKNVWPLAPSSRRTRPARITRGSIPPPKTGRFEAGKTLV
jgi:hypothetical protein